MCGVLRASYLILAYNMKIVNVNDLYADIPNLFTQLLYNIQQNSLSSS